MTQPLRELPQPTREQLQPVRQHNLEFRDQNQPLNEQKYNTMKNISTGEKKENKSLKDSRRKDSKERI